MTKKFEVGDVIRVIDNTGSLDGCGIEIGAMGQVVHCFTEHNVLAIEIENRHLLVCDDEIELLVRGLN